MNEPTTQAAAGILAVFALDLLKKSTLFPFLTPKSCPTVKAVWGGVAAFVATMGVGVVFDYDFLHDGKVTFMIPAAWTMVHTLKDFAFQWSWQQLIWKVQKQGQPS